MVITMFALLVFLHGSVIQIPWYIWLLWCGGFLLRLTVNAVINKN